MNPSPTPLEQLFPTINQQLAIRSIYFLLDNTSSVNLYSFVSYTLPRILEQLHHTTVRVNTEYQGRVRGRVVWPATYKARFSQDYNPTLYHCRQVQLFFDTPENQLLKHLIEEIYRHLQSMPKIIRYGVIFNREKTIIQPIMARLQVLETRIQETLRNIYLRQITSIPHITHLHLQRAENSRLEEYAAIANLYRYYRQVLDRSSWHPFDVEGQRFLLLPNQASRETDIWIQLAATLVRTYHLHGD